MSEQETSAEQKPKPQSGSPEPEASRASEQAPNGAEEAPGAGEVAGTDDEPQNRRARRAAAARARKQRMRERAEAEAIGLGAQEMLDDAFARSTDRAARWLKNNASVLQWIGIVALAIWAGWGIYDWRTGKTKAHASDALAEGLHAQNGMVRGTEDPDTVPNEQDPTPIFDDQSAQLNAMREAFATASDMRPGSGTSNYARLALASTLLKAGNHDEALEHFRQVNASEFAKSDPELRGRALEGIGLALEAQGDHEAALQGFKDLETANIPGFTELALYHQARMHRELDQIDQAKEVTKRLQAELPEPGPLAFAPSYLQQTARALADSLGVVEAEQAPPGLDQPITPEKLREIQEQVQREINQRSQQPTSGGQEEESTPPEPAAPPAENP